VIDVIATRIKDAGRSRSVFRAFVWRKAHVILDDARVWLGVEALAESLCDYWPPSRSVGALEKIARHLAMPKDKPTVKREAENPLTLLIRQVEESSFRTAPLRVVGE
jgi:hypothetical protein